MGRNEVLAGEHLVEDESCTIDITLLVVGYEL